MFGLSSKYRHFRNHIIECLDWVAQTSIKFKCKLTLTCTYLPFVQPSPEYDEFLHIHVYIYIYIYYIFYALYYIMHVESVKLSCDKHNNNIY
jgi:hypothetical protein